MTISMCIHGVIIMIIMIIIIIIIIIIGLWGVKFASK
jgi:hypothetical protein